MKKIILLLCLIMCSCASTYKINGKTYRVHDNNPRPAGFIIAIGFGLGEQIRDPKR